MTHGDESEQRRKRPIQEAEYRVTIEVTVIGPDTDWQAVAEMVRDAARHHHFANRDFRVTAAKLDESEELES